MLKNDREQNTCEWKNTHSENKELAHSPHRKQIRKRVGMGCSAFGKHSSINMSSNLQLFLKRKVYNQCTYILVILTHDLETWCFTKRKKEKKIEKAKECRDSKREKNTG